MTGVPAPSQLLWNANNKSSAYRSLCKIVLTCRYVQISRSEATQKSENST